MENSPVLERANAGNNQDCIFNPERRAATPVIAPFRQSIARESKRIAPAFSSITRTLRSKPTETKAKTMKTQLVGKKKPVAKIIEAKKAIEVNKTVDEKKLTEIKKSTEEKKPPGDKTSGKDLK